MIPTRVLTIVGVLATLALLLFLLKPATVAPPASGIETTAPRAPVPAIPTAPVAAGADLEPAPAAVTTTRSDARPTPPEAGIDLPGWVGNANGSGLGGIEIRAESQGSAGEDSISARTTTDGNGDFILDHILPGRQYRVEIKPQGDYAGHLLDAFTTDSAEDLKKIILDRVELVDAEGMIVDTNHAPVADFELSVRSMAVEFPERVIRSDSTGYFKLAAFPAGELRIATNASDYYRIKGLELKPDAYQNLTLMIDRGSYHLSGWVSDDYGAPLAQAQVTLKSAFRTDGYHSFSYRATVTDDNGGFEFSELGGHRLTLGVYASGFATYIRQHDFKSFADIIEIRLRPEE